MIAFVKKYSSLVAQYALLLIAIVFGGLLVLGIGIYLDGTISFFLYLLKIELVHKSFFSYVSIIVSILIVSFLYGLVLSETTPTKNKIVPILAAASSSLWSVGVLQMAPLMQGVFALTIFASIYAGFFGLKKPEAL